MSIRILSVLFSMFLSMCAAPVFAQLPGGIEQFADRQLRFEIAGFCEGLLAQYPVENTAQSCADIHNACENQLFDRIKADLEATVAECSNLPDYSQILCNSQRRAGIMENARNDAASLMENFCQPLPPAPVIEDPQDKAEEGNVEEVVNEGDFVQDGQHIVGEDQPKTKGGCTLTGLGGASGNLFWMSLGLLPLLGLRRKR